MRANQINFSSGENGRLDKQRGDCTAGFDQRLTVIAKNRNGDTYSSGPTRLSDEPGVAEAPKSFIDRIVKKVRDWDASLRLREERQYAVGLFTVAVERLPSAQKFEQYYRCVSSDPAVHQTCINALGVVRMEVLREILNKTVALRPDSTAYCVALRKFFDTVLGPHADPAAARRACVELMGIKHPDKQKVGVLTGARNAEVVTSLFDMLNRIKETMDKEKDLIKKIYAPPEKPVPQGWLRSLGKFTFGLLLCSLRFIACGLAFIKISR
jgi:hypothetical protein